MIRRSALVFGSIALALLLLLCCARPATAQDYKIAAGSTPLPAEVAAPVRALLSPVSLAVTNGSAPYCEIWVRTTIPSGPQASAPLGVSYGQLVDGEIIGAIHFDGAVKDFRSQAVKPGTYVLRYGLQPVDGNHQGVSDFRDFVLLTPAGQDTSAANLADNDMYVLSRKATTTGHPSVWSLVPTDSAPTLLPGTKHDTNEELWIAYFKAAVGASPTTIGLVIDGHATAP